MKKLLVLVLAAMMIMTACFATAEGFSGEIKLWVADSTVDFTKGQIEIFKTQHPEYADMTVIIEPVGEGEAATNLITDVEKGADVFTFAQDQLARLVAVGAVESVAPENMDAVIAENDAGSVAAVTMGDTMYAYPMTADNGYFLYYDKSVVTDPSTLEGILEQCAAAGKSFYMEINSAWYQTAFFFGAGCTLTYDSDDEGNLTGINCTYASEEGVKALKAMIETAKSPAFVNGSSAANTSNMAALVSGTWDVASVKSLLGDNYAATKLPTVGGFQMSGFGGYKLLGVKPQEDEAKLAACDALAAFLTSEEVQTARFEAVGWGPSNLKAKASEAVQNDIAQRALAEQLGFCVPQGQYPNEYWALGQALGDDVLADLYDNADDATLLDVLQKFQDTASSYVAK